METTGFEVAQDHIASTHYTLSVDARVAEVKVELFSLVKGVLLQAVSVHIWASPRDLWQRYREIYNRHVNYRTKDTSTVDAIARASN